MSIFDRIRKLFAGQSATNGSGRRPDPGTGAPVLDDGETISCEEALRRVHDYLDGELDGVPADEVRRHFEVCGHCYPHLRLETAYREAVRRAAAGETAPPELKGRVQRLLAEAEAED